MRVTNIVPTSGYFTAVFDGINFVEGHTFFWKSREELFLLPPSGGSIRANTLYGWKSSPEKLQEMADSGRLIFLVK